MCELKRYKTSNSQIDKCMRKAIVYLKLYDIKIVACCCGHRKYPMSIIVDNGKSHLEIFSHKEIPRTRNFYKKDEEGYYFIPEVTQSKEGICECGHTQWAEHKSSFYNYKGLKMVAQECNVKGCKCKKFIRRKIK